MTTIANEREAGSRWRAVSRRSVAVRNTGPWSWAIGVGVVGVIIGLLASGNEAFNWSYALVDAIFGLGCAIALSWGRIAAFGQALYFSAGGYTAALLVPHHLPALIVVLAGALAAGIIACVFSVITIRLGFSSFAMLTLVIGQAGNQLIYTIDKLGGENGLIGVTRPVIFGSMTDKTFYFYCLAFLVVLVFFARWFYQSTTGRFTRAVRDDPVRAEALGVNVNKTRVLTYTIAGIVCGVAGGLYSQLQGVVDPSMGDFTQSTIGVMMVVIGGLGTFLGGAFGGIIYRWLDLYTTNNTSAPALWLGIIFIAVVLLTPVVAGAVRRVRARTAPRRQAEGMGNATHKEANR